MSGTKDYDLFGYKSDSSVEDFITQPPEIPPFDDDVLEYDDESNAAAKSTAPTPAEMDNLTANLKDNVDMLR